MAQEQKRKCGYRKIGGLYLCSDGAGERCHRLPFPLDVCPVCHSGIKQARGWTWLDWVAVAGPADCVKMMIHCSRCPVCSPTLIGLAHDKDGNVEAGVYNRVGLLWVGDKFYTPANFTQEAEEMGVSRRIAAVPQGFKLGEHFVMLAHPKAVNVTGAGIFHVFKPTRIEKILADTADPQEVKKWEEKGFTVVKLSAGDKDHTGTVYDREEQIQETA